MRPPLVGAPLSPPTGPIYIYWPPFCLLGRQLERMAGKGSDFY